MIKFFRKIRYDLMGENPPDGRAGKTGKYIKYAIGEIILVVVGILIALSINNWNINRQNNEVRRTYYVQILQDLEKDKSLMKEKIVIGDSFFVRLQSYKETFKEPDISIWGAAESIGLVFSSKSQPGWNIEVNTNTVITLQNTGDIKLIPLNIRNKILDFKYKQLGLQDYLRTQGTIIINFAMTTKRLYGGSDLPNRIGNQSKLMKYFEDEKIEVQSLLELEALLDAQSKLIVRSKERFKDLIRDIEEIKTLINKELKK